MNSYKECEKYLAGGRDKNNRPLANNTRMERRPNAITIRFHATDIVTYYADGRIILNTGGWHTVTTSDRIHRFSPSKGPYSVDGIWYLDAKPSSNDPRPFPVGTYVHRSIPKPYEIANPGAEPRKPEGHAWEQHKQSAEDQMAWKVWAKWHAVMHGNGYGTSRGNGYAKMIEMLEEHGSRDAWQNAYITEFRDVREKRSELKAWEQRNRVRFYDGIEIDADGYGTARRHFEDAA